MPNSAEQIADEILVINAQGGQRESFDLLVCRWQKRLWWHAFNLTGRKEAAWDVVQESWLDIVRSLTRLNHPAKFGPWAYRIVSHKSYDWRHRYGSESPREVEPEGTPAANAEQGRHETSCDVYDILRQLPARAQVVLNLYYLEGFSLAEIAVILGTPEGTVKSRLHAARIEFRRHWESLGNTAPAAIPAAGKEGRHD
jgi:RNA polymerase sigma-70 factor (ECF subfamily)